MNAPLVSVIIPTHNNADTIGQAIESVIRQTFGAWQLVVVDDESTDATRTVVNGYRTVLGSRLRYVRQLHAGSSAARNTGIDRAKGRWLAFLDADDEYLPDKLARQMDLSARFPRLGMVFCDMAYVDLAGRCHASSFAEQDPALRTYTRRAVGSQSFVCGPDFSDVMVGHYIIPTITAMVRRDVLSETVRFPIGFPYSEEWLFFLDVAHRCPVGLVDVPLAVHHHRRGSLSRTSTTANVRNQIRVLERILERYTHASAVARAELGTQLAWYRRQLGMDYAKSGRYGDALGQFAGALRHRTNVRTITDVVRAFVEVCVHGRGRGRTAGEPTREPVA